MDKIFLKVHLSTFMRKWQKPREMIVNINNIESSYQDTDGLIICVSGFDYLVSDEDMLMIVSAIADRTINA
jgi:hypothetical protein